MICNNKILNFLEYGVLEQYSKVKSYILNKVKFYMLNLVVFYLWIWNIPKKGSTKIYEILEYGIFEENSKNQ